jgi:hypothetical protein
MQSSSVRTNGGIEVYGDLSQSIPPIETVVEHEQAVTDMARGAAAPAETTKVPNWVFPILASVLFILVGFVYTTIEKQIDELRSEKAKEVQELKDRVTTEETWRARTREQLIEHGWKVDGDTLIAPNGGNHAASSR